MVPIWVSSHESEVDVIVYIVYTAVLLSSSVLYCTVQCPYVVIREVDYYGVLSVSKLQNRCYIYIYAVVYLLNPPCTYVNIT